MGDLLVLNIEPIDSKWTDDSKVQPCPICLENKSSNCGYGEYDYFGDFDCTHENAGQIGWVCDSCPELACHKCKSFEQSQIDGMD